MCDLKLSTLAADSSGQLDIFRHDGDSLGVDGAQVGIFEKADQVCLASLLQGHDSGALETQIRLEVLCDFTDEALEGQLADEQLGALLVTADLTKSDCARPVTMRFLHPTGSRCTFACGLRRQLLPRGLATGRFTCCLLRASHDYVDSRRNEMCLIRIARLVFIVWGSSLAGGDCQSAIGSRFEGRSLFRAPSGVSIR